MSSCRCAPDPAMGWLSHLRLRCFRNYTDLDIDFGAGLNVLLGDNGQGKTNLLEAIFYLALLRSFRTRNVQALRQWNAAHFFVGGTVLGVGSEVSETELSVGSGVRRQLKINGAAIERGSEFINQFLCVALVPEDIELAKGAAAVRRRFLDIAISQLDTAYLYDLRRYKLAVRSRNCLLREWQKYSQTALAGYDALVVRHGSRIWRRRQRFLVNLNRRLQEDAERFLPEPTQRLTLKWQWNLDGQVNVESDTEVAAGFERLLDKGLAKDKSEGRTRYGPHRDDVKICLGGRALGAYGSEGECRLACLLLRLATFAVLREQAGAEKPVVLLVDDVFGELDGKRRTAFFSMLASADQVLLVGTEMPHELQDAAARVYNVENGTVRTDCGTGKKGNG